MGNKGKIDIHQQTNLSNDQCDSAIGTWRRLGVFDIESDIAPKADYQEEVIWKETFYNYLISDERDVNKLKRLTTQIIDRYKDTMCYNGVDRISVRKDGESYCLICKPSTNTASISYSRRVGTAATHIVKADKTNEGFKLGRETFRDMLQKVERHYPDLTDRIAFYGKMQTQIQGKINSSLELLKLGYGDSKGPVQDEKSEEENDRM